MHPMCFLAALCGRVFRVGSGADYVPQPLVNSSPNDKQPLAPRKYIQQTLLAVMNWLSSRVMPTKISESPSMSYSARGTSRARTAGSKTVVTDQRFRISRWTAILVLVYATVAVLITLAMLSAGTHDPQVNDAQRVKGLGENSVNDALIRHITTDHLRGSTQASSGKTPERRLSGDQPLTSGRSSSRIPWLPRHALVAVLATVVGLAIVCSMFNPGGSGSGGGSGSRGRQQPPAWRPENETTYPFRHWVQDLLAWSILATDMDSAQQCAAIILQLGGAARELTRNLSFTDMSQGGLINGEQVDPVTFLLTHLASQFAPLGEESRLQATRELFDFRRNRSETIDALLSRFMALRFRASTNGGAAMSWEGYSWLLLRACGVNSSQLMTILQPFNNRYPNTEAEFNSMSTTLRRIGHILEHAPGNIAGALRDRPSSGWFVEDNFAGMVDASPQSGGGTGDPWVDQGLDPWASAAAAYPVAASSSEAPVAAASTPASEIASGTDTDTESDDAASLDYAAAEYTGLTPEQLDEHLFWTYQEAKTKWRKHMHKPTRKVRRFFKKRRKGKGKGKGRNRFAFLTEMSDQEYDSMFFGGKGKSKGKSRTSGKGKGRRKNPRGYDGLIMKCSICGSEEHLRARCPQNTGQASGSGTSAPSAFGGYVDSGPLAGVAGVAFLASATEVTVAAHQSAPAPAAPARPSSLQGSWAAPDEAQAGSWSTLTTVQTVEVEASMWSIPNPFGTDAFGAAMPMMQPPMAAPVLQSAAVLPALQAPAGAGPSTWPAMAATGPSPSIWPASALPVTPLAPQTSMWAGMPAASAAPAPPTYNIATPPSAGASTLPAVPAFPGNVPTWDQRAAAVLQTATDSEPRPAASALASQDRPATHIPMLADFQQLSGLRQQQWQARGQRRHLRPERQPWAHLAEQPASAGSVLGEARPSFSVDTSIGIYELHQHMQLTDQQVESRRAQRQQRIQVALAAQRSGDLATANLGVDPLAPAEQHLQTCGICLGEQQDMDWVTTLTCHHRFHQECLDQWMSHLVGANAARVTCPICRATVEPLDTHRAGLAPVLLEHLTPPNITPRSTVQSEQAVSSPPHTYHQESPQAQSHSSPAQQSWNFQGTPFQSPMTPGAASSDLDDELSSAWAAPWWPAPGTAISESAPYYHAATKLHNGQLSMIVDPGAWTNLMGEKLARDLAERAVKSGLTPRQEPMEKPLSIQGVGNGFQECKFQMSTPIAVADDRGKTTMHQLTVPIVTGSGADLPGLLGLRSMESLRAILDMGNRELILPGAGDPVIEWPAGTTRIPLSKAPSGHLVMVVDDFEKALKQKSGLPERTVELLAESHDSSPSSTPAVESAPESRPETPAAPGGSASHTFGL